MALKFSGEKLKYWRKQRRMTQKELGAILKLENTDIWKYENGVVKNPEPDRIEALAGALNVKVVDLCKSPDEVASEPEKPIDQQVIDLLLSLDDATREHVIYFVQQIVSRGLHKKRQ